MLTLPPSGTQRHIPVKKVLASSDTVHNTRLGSPLLRGKPQWGFFHASLNWLASVEELGVGGEDPNLSPREIMALRPVIGLLLSVLPVVYL